ncbi:hypothetical protein DSECCO2_633500 [anaerobic digester metagenome]|jgi:hypothetical protein
MRTRIRIGPFTFGKSGMRLSLWRGGTGFSIPLFNRKTSSFGKVKLGIFSFYFGGKSKKGKRVKTTPNYIEKIRTTHKKAYEPWTDKADHELISLFREGKTVKDLSEIFGRTQGAIRSRINKILIE